MSKRSNFLVKVYLSSKDIDKVVEIFADDLFAYCSKELKRNFKNRVALGFIDRLQSVLFSPKYDIKDSKHYFEDSFYYDDFNESQFRLLNEMAEEINKRFLEYENKYIITSKYQDVFENYASNIRPSISKRGNISTTEIDNCHANIRKIKSENKKLFDYLNSLSTKNNCGTGLIMWGAREALKLKRIDKENNYQFNLTNEEGLKILRSYCDATNTPYYADEYTKISLLRRILTQLVIFCFSSDYDITEEGYLKMKFHTRLILSLKKKSTSGLFSNTIYNHYITFNDNNLLHKLFYHSHSITLKNTNSIISKKNTDNHISKITNNTS